MLEFRLAMLAGSPNGKEHGLPKGRWRNAQSYMSQGLSLAHLRNERSDWLKVPGSLDEVRDGSRQKSRWRETLEPHFKFIILAKIQKSIQIPSQGKLI